jgi:hypothetical protein
MKIPPATIAEQLNARYAQGLFAVICTNYKIIPIRDQSLIRASKDGKGVYFKSGKNEIYAYAYQVKFAR